MAATEPARRLRIPNLIGALVGAGVGLYSGIHLIVPVVATAAAWWVGKKALKADRSIFLPAIAIQTGHLIWFSLGLVVLGQFGGDLLDVVILLAGLIWLIAKPGLGPVILLTVFQALALVVNAFAFFDPAVGENVHKALLVHIIWRILALSLMWHAYLKFRKGPQADTAAIAS